MRLRIGTLADPPLPTHPTPPRHPQFLGLVERVGLDEVADALPSATQSFAPLFVADHFAAM